MRSLGYITDVLKYHNEVGYMEHGFQYNAFYVQKHIASHLECPHLWNSTIYPTGNAIATDNLAT